MTNVNQNSLKVINTHFPPSGKQGKKVLFKSYLKKTHLIMICKEKIIPILVPQGQGEPPVLPVQGSRVEIPEFLQGES